MSPILANVYLHYVFDLWTHRWRRRATGDVIIIRYADDTIVGFQHEHEADAFLDDLKERPCEYELVLHPAKTRLIRFGRHAPKQRKRRGEGKPETFDLLGFTHFCTRSRKNGSFVIGRKTIKKRMRATLQAIKVELRKRLHDPISKTGAWVYSVLKGHLNYFAISGNDPSLWWFSYQVKWRWLRALRRRAVSGPTSTGRDTSGSSTASCRRSGYCTRYPVTASTPEPEGGARCVNSARRDLRGGRPATVVPTATIIREILSCL